ncbi:polymer-forming cytoskeletal protein [Patescibacteria group bacterium]|nr:polymer-forming cytoskeletal protein [Patescibacteria group bacterium]
MEQLLQRFAAQEIFQELRNAERENRTADFSNKLLPEFSFSGREISTGINFKGSTIQGALHLDECIIKGDVNLEQALIYATLYLSKTEIQGEFFANQIRIRGVLNMVASTFKKNIYMKESSVKGFLGLNKVQIEGNLDISKSVIKDIVTKTGTIRGDVYLRDAKVGGSVIAGEIISEGLGNFEKTSIGQNLDLKNSKFKEVVILSGTIVEGEIEAQNLQCKSLIAHVA